MSVMDYVATATSSNFPQLKHTHSIKSSPILSAQAHGVSSSLKLKSCLLSPAPIPAQLWSQYCSQIQPLGHAVLSKGSHFSAASSLLEPYVTTLLLARQSECCATALLWSCHEGPLCDGRRSLMLHSKASHQALTFFALGRRHAARHWLWYHVVGGNIWKLTYSICYSVYIQRIQGNVLRYSPTLDTAQHLISHCF
jgi:hypothetical protein